MLVYYIQNRRTILCREVAPAQVHNGAGKYCLVELYIQYGEPYTVEAWTDYEAAREALMCDLRAQKLMIDEALSLLKQSETFERYTELCRKAP